MTDKAQYQHVVEILHRYPDIDEEDRRLVLHLIQKAPALDNALLTSIDEIRPKLKAFRLDHRKELGPKFSHYLTVISLLILAAISIHSLWDIGAK